MLDQHVLIVHPDLEMGEMLQEILAIDLPKEIPDQKYRVFTEWVRSQQDVENRIDAGKDYQLIITSLDVPSDKKSPIVDKGGIKLITKLRLRKIETPVIVLVVDVNEELLEEVKLLQPLETVRETIREGEEVQKELIRKCRKWFEHINLQDRANLDITLDWDEDEGLYLWKLNCKRFNFEKYGHLVINDQELMRLKSDTKELEKDQKWQTDLHKIGERLGNEIFSKENRRLFRHFCEVKDQVGGIENTRVRFIVGEKIYPIILEALKEESNHENNEKSNKELWMLNAPMYRNPRLHPSSGSNESRKIRDGLINFRIIQSNAYGFAPEIDGELIKLQGINDETTKLENYLNQYKEFFNIGKIKLLKEPEGDCSFKDTVNNILEEHGPWHFVHYAGHSYYYENNNKNEEEEKGYVFFPKTGDNSPEEVGIKDFAEWLGKAHTGFVYLSSCSSAKTGFVFELAKKNIPAVLGFRWDTNDQKAHEFAVRFYEHFFGDNKLLEYAFLGARQDIYARYPDDRIWASPMLVMMKEN